MRSINTAHWLIYAVGLTNMHKNICLSDVYRLVGYLAEDFEISKADKYSLEQKFVLTDKGNIESRPLTILVLQPEYAISSSTVALPVSIFSKDRFSGSNIYQKGLDQIFVIAGSGSDAIVYPINASDLDMYRMISTSNVRLIQVNGIYTAVIDVSLCTLEKLSFKPFTISL